MRWSRASQEVRNGLQLLHPLGPYNPLCAGLHIGADWTVNGLLLQIEIIVD